MLKRIIVSCFILCGICNNAMATPAVVNYIVDGDTFSATVKLQDGIEIMSVRVRLINIDTPEIHGNCDYEIKMAQYAKQRLGELIPVGSTVELKNVKNDKYMGRIDANVYDSIGRDVGLVLISEKVGRPYSGGKRQSWCD